MKATQHYSHYLLDHLMQQMDALHHAPTSTWKEDLVQHSTHKLTLINYMYVHERCKYKVLLTFM